MDLKEPLKEYGLGDKEIEVYLLLLQLGESHLQELSGRMDYPKTTVYNTLKYLVRRGLASTRIKDKKTFYSPADPSRIREDAERKMKIIEEILPSLSKLKNNIPGASAVEMYEGTKGLYTIYMDIFRKQQMVYFFGRGTHYISMLGHLPEKARTIRVERKIPAKIIIEPTTNPLFETPGYKKITEMRFLKSLADFPCMIYIYGNKVAIFTIRKEVVGFIIDNEQVSHAMKFIFDNFWEQAS